MLSRLQQASSKEQEPANLRLTLVVIRKITCLLSGDMRGVFVRASGN